MPDKTGKAKFVTLREMADALMMHPATLAVACGDGRIRALKMGTSWRVPMEEYERVLAEGFSAEPGQRKGRKAA